MLYAHGVYIGKRRVGRRTMLLYQLESFYVELCYRKYRCSVNHVHCFQSTSLLDPYLAEMDVEVLV